LQNTVLNVLKSFFLFLALEHNEDKTEINFNLKCSDSLLSNWEELFPNIKTNKFDLVIGNPPYVRHESLKEIKPYLEKEYESYTGTADLFVYFLRGG